MLLFLLLLTSMVLAAQDTLTIDSNNSELGILNETIAGDTTDTGERIHSVYRLKRGQTYLLSGSIENSNDSGDSYPLSIVAEKGNDPKPRIIAAVIGSVASRPFRVRDNLTMRNLYITGLDEMGALNTAQQIIRVSVINARIIVDDCHIDQDGQSAFRIDNPGVKLYVTNSIISNIGRPNNTNNGRAVDDRGSDIDTLILENNTFYNISSTLMNDRGGWIKYAKVNQNTIVHTGQRIFDFNETQTAIFTNNLVINPGYLGIEDNPDPSTIDPGDLGELIRVDSLSEQSKSALPDIAQTFVYSNNNIVWNSEVMGAWPQDSSDYGGADYRIIQRPLFNATAEAMAGEAQIATNFSELIVFEEQPPVEDLVVVIDQFWNDPNENDSKISVKQWDISDEPFDFSFDKSFFSAFASTENGAIGSSQWSIGDDCSDIAAVKSVLPDQLMLSFDRSGSVSINESDLLDGLALCNNTLFSFTPSRFDFENEQTQNVLQVNVVQFPNEYTKDIPVTLGDEIPPTIDVTQTITVTLDQQNQGVFDLENLPDGIVATDNTALSRVFIKNALDCSTDDLHNLYVFAEDVFNNVDSVLADVIIDCPLSVDRGIDYFPIVYPNPVTSMLFLELDERSMEESSISIVDIGGKTVYVPMSKEGDRLSVDFSSLKSGLYFVSVFQGDRQIVVKVIRSY